MEQTIKRLCEELGRSNDEREVRRLCAELHVAIHQHIEVLRQQVFNIQVVPGSFVTEKEKKAG